MSMPIIFVVSLLFAQPMCTQARRIVKDAESASQTDAANAASYNAVDITAHNHNASSSESQGWGVALKNAIKVAFAPKKTLTGEEDSLTKEFILQYNDKDACPACINVDGRGYQGSVAVTDYTDSAIHDPDLFLNVVMTRKGRNNYAFEVRLARMTTEGDKGHGEIDIIGGNQQIDWRNRHGETIVIGGSRQIEKKSVILFHGNKVNNWDTNDNLWTFGASRGSKFSITLDGGMGAGKMEREHFQGLAAFSKTVPVLRGELLQRAGSVSEGWEKRQVLKNLRIEVRNNRDDSLAYYSFGEQI